MRRWLTDRKIKTLQRHAENLEEVIDFERRQQAQAAANIDRAQRRIADIRKRVIELRYPVPRKPLFTLERARYYGRVSRYVYYHGVKRSSTLIASATFDPRAIGATLSPRLYFAIAGRKDCTGGRQAMWRWQIDLPRWRFFERFDRRSTNTGS